MSLRLAITLGDPAGIGPEVTEAAIAAVLKENPDLRFVLLGPAGIAENMAARLGHTVEAQSQEEFFGAVGRASAESGRAALAALMAGITLAQRREVGALVTAPISKAALALAGSADLGHTTILERELSAGPVSMAFFSDRLRVALLSAHISMRQMLETLSGTRVLEVTRLLADALRGYLGVAAPRLVLAGLNPHAGEGGLMGNEEARILIPAVAEARRQGLSLVGPLPPDTLFRRAYDGEFDGVVAIYHDQALIPVKMLGLGSAVHITLGLEVPRTSPDHGTAFELVGTGRANPGGMAAAIRMAARIALS
jgi:4-hydroxythreonine-4-phosphate dehydrogenase